MLSPSGSVSTASSAEAMDQMIHSSMRRAELKARDLKSSTSIHHGIKQRHWRKFVEHEMSEIKDILKSASLSARFSRAALEYIQALERSQTGSSLRGRTWMQKLAGVSEIGAHSRAVFSETSEGS